MLNLNEIEPKGLLIDIDFPSKSATVLKFGVWGDIIQAHALHAELMGSISTMVSLNLNSAVLDLTIQEQTTIVRYVMEHTLNKQTYAMAVALYNNHEPDLIRAVRQLLDYASTNQ